MIKTSLLICHWDIVRKAYIRPFKNNKLYYNMRVILQYTDSALVIIGPYIDDRVMHVTVKRTD